MDSDYDGDEMKRFGISSSSVVHTAGQCDMKTAREPIVLQERERERERARHGQMDETRGSMHEELKRREAKCYETGENAEKDGDRENA